ncbi:uncharacterized protein FMAN_09966 [Fusarium mangiferae]|uniref:Uncharacterized protein n=1 Tax=Fusarium mangiferae TaxID=192010 RepID=A0A1L7TYV1_FUSMA|nr:uncharacterized protein FMAN_09966 [Fusarium mangiferae]CVL00567.1 uncharacterized protein FMAN_09966 [Fusarium mangiferae]
MADPNSNSLHKLLSTRHLSTNAPSPTTSATAHTPDTAPAFLYTQQDSNAIDFDDFEAADWPDQAKLCGLLSWERLDCLYAGVNHRSS